MTLAVRNSTPNTVYVVVGYPNKGCSNPPRAKRGWYTVRPGRTVAIYAEVLPVINFSGMRRMMLGMCGMIEDSF